MDEYGTNASRNEVGRVFGPKGSRSVHTLIPNEREWISVLTAINVEVETMSNFYIFKGIRPRRNYLVLCEDGASFGMQKKGWIDSYLFSKWMDHFLAKMRKRGLLSSTARHLLMLDGHKAHLTLEVATKAKKHGVDMLTLPSHTSHGLQLVDVSCFKPFKVAFRAYKNLWTMKHHGVRVTKETLANWVSLALKNSLTAKNIQEGFRGAGIWPLNLEAMKLKMSPSQRFKRPTIAKVQSEEEEINGITEEGLPLPPIHAIHFHVDSLEADAEIDVGLEDDDIEERLESPTTITTFLRMPQEVVPRPNTKAKSLVDYSQSQIITSDEHVDNLYSIQQRKEEIALEKEAKRVERELTKVARAQERQQLREARENRAHERQAKRALNTTEFVAAQEEAKKLYKSKWIVIACEEAGQKLHDLIKQGGPISNSNLYLGTQPLVCKRNQQVAIARMRAKKKERKKTHLCQPLIPHWCCHIFTLLLRVCYSKVCLHTLLGLSSSLLGFFVLHHPPLLLECSLNNMCSLDIPKVYDGLLNLAHKEIERSFAFLLMFCVALILCL